MSTFLLRLIAAIQFVLGVLYLAAPQWLLARMGHTAAPPDLLYPLAMLAARFIAYGVGLWAASADASRHAPWIRLMALVQLIDLGAGLVATLSGTVGWALSAFPMFNALWIGLACWRLGGPMRSTPAAAA